MEKQKVYVVIEDSVVDYEPSHNIFVFSEFDKAKKKMKKLINQSGILEEVKNNEDMIATADDTFYEAYLDGYYDENHYYVSIKEEEVL